MPSPIVNGSGGGGSGSIGGGSSIGTNNTSTSTTKKRFSSFRARRIQRNKEKDTEDAAKKMLIFQPATTPTNTELLHDVADNEIKISTATATATATAATVIPFDDDDKTEYADCDDSIEENENNKQENEKEVAMIPSMTTAPAPMNSIPQSPIEQRSGFEVPQNVEMTRIEI
jgi:hypothetical protein